MIVEGWKLKLRIEMDMGDWRLVFGDLRKGAATEGGAEKGSGKMVCEVCGQLLEGEKIPQCFDTIL